MKHYLSSTCPFLWSSIIVFLLVPSGILFGPPCPWSPCAVFWFPLGFFSLYSLYPLLCCRGLIKIQVYYITLFISIFFKFSWILSNNMDMLYRNCKIEPHIDYYDWMRCTHFIYFCVEVTLLYPRKDCVCDCHRWTYRAENDYEWKFEIDGNETT